MRNYFKDQKLRDQRASKLVEKIQKQEKKPFEKGETPAETLVNLHNSEVLEDFNSWLNGLEYSVTEDLQKQIAVLKSKLASLSIALGQMRSGQSSTLTQAPSAAPSSMQGEARLKSRSNASASRQASSVNTTSVWIRDAKGEVIRNPNFSLCSNTSSRRKTSYDKSFYQCHYGVSYDPTGHNGSL